MVKKNGGLKLGQFNIRITAEKLTMISFFTHALVLV